MGYPWLEENALNIFPAQDALPCGLQLEISLGGWGPLPRGSKSPNVWQIRKGNMCVRIKDGETVQIRTIVSSEGEWGEHQPLVDGLRKALLTDYPDVLVDISRPKSPVQRAKCEARNHLKEGATPKKMRLMQMNAERRESTEKITDDWLKAEKIERCDGPWSASCFPFMRPAKHQGDSSVFAL